MKIPISKMKNKISIHLNLFEAKIKMTIKFSKDNALVMQRGKTTLLSFPFSAY